MALNEQIIMPVFQEMVKHNPKLGLLLPAPDDEEEEVDVRRLAREIISGFPWPIGAEFERLFSSGFDELNQKRLYQILKLVERSVQFLVFMLLSQLLEESLKRQLIYPDNSFRELFPSIFQRLYLGGYIRFIESLREMFKVNEIEPFIPEMQALLTRNFYGKLKPWLPVRNKISHYLVNLDEEEIQKRCVAFQQDLVEVYTDLAFFVKYPLVTILDIQVDKRKRKPAKFIHAVKHFPDYAGKRREYKAYTENHAVLLLKSVKNAPEAYLNLSPLIIDTRTEKLDTPEKKKNIKMDLFMYLGYTREPGDKMRLHYVGTRVGEDECDLRCLSCYDQLVEEVQEYFTRFGTKK